MKKIIKHDNKKFKHICNSGPMLIYACGDLRIIADIAGNVIYEYSTNNDPRLVRRTEINNS